MAIDKRKVNQIGNKVVTGDNVKIAILFIPLLVLLVRQVQSGEFSAEMFFDTSVLVSFLAVFICEAIAAAITGYINAKTEDDMKLALDYAKLVKKYPLESQHMVKRQNADGTLTTLPVLLLHARKIGSLQDAPYKIAIERSERKKYVLPSQVADNSGVLFGAHGYSTVYNNVNIRLDDLAVSADGGEVTLRYSFTTYFDSLITNRAMDYPLDDLRTVREIFEPGPMMSTLAESRLSNHLGFNGFVELSDGSIIFVYRGKNVSIAKQQWAQSVGASLKTAYCLDADRNLTLAGLSRAIRKEISDELKIDVPEEENLCDSIFAFYRDMVEGGKPQFLFYYKAATVGKEAFLERFGQALSGKEAQRENNERQIVDGQRFAFLTMQDLRKATIRIDKLVLSTGEQMTMMPSSLASLALLLENFGG